MFKNNDAFTLVEMLIVLMIISILIILIVPTISDSKDTINEKGCQALTAVVQTQVELYHFDEGSYPSDVEELITAEYINESQKTCPNNQEIKIEDGTIVVKDPNEASE